MYNGNLNKYSQYSMNMNMRKVFIDEKKLKVLIENLEKSKEDIGFSKLLLEELQAQYEDYKLFKDKPKSQIQGRRRIELGPLLGDRQGLLVAYGCSLTEHKLQYTINLFHHLDIILAVTFNVKLSYIQEKLNEIATKYNMSISQLSLLCLSLNCSDDTINNSSLLLEDFTAIQEINDFILTIIKDNMYNNVQVLSNIEGINFLNYVETPEEEYSNLPLAFLFKILLGASKIIKSIIVRFYEQGLKGIVISQDFCSLTFGTNQPLTAFKYQTEQEIIQLPMQKIM